MTIDTLLGYISYSKMPAPVCTMSATDFIRYLNTYPTTRLMRLGAQDGSDAKVLMEYINADYLSKQNPNLNKED